MGVYKLTIFVSKHSNKVSNTMVSNLNKSQILNQLQIQNLEVDTSMCDIQSPFHYQGVIIDNVESGVCIAPGFPVAKEIDDITTFQKIITEMFGKGMLLRPYLEGFVVRIYNYENNWFMSTNKCLDAYTSNYNSDKTFGEMFEEVLKCYFDKEDIELGYNLQTIDDFISNLDKSYCYFFLVGHPELKVTHKIENPYLYLLYATSSVDGEIITLKTIPNIPSIYEVACPFINSQMINKESKGFVLESSNKRYVWFSPTFKYIRKRNSHKYLGSFLLELNENPQQCVEYYKMFPEHSKYQDMINEAIDSFCKDAHKLYVTRHIKKSFIETSNKSLHYFVSDRSNQNNLFGIYLKTRQNMYLEDILKIFTQYPRTSKFIFLRSYLSNDLIGDN